MNELLHLIHHVNVASASFIGILTDVEAGVLLSFIYLHKFKSNKGHTNENVEEKRPKGTYPLLLLK